MSQFLYRKNGVSHSVEQVRELHPQTMIPAGADLADLGYQRITPTPRPAFDAVRQGVREVAPVDGLQAWQVYPLPPDVLAANEAVQAATARQLAKDTRQELVNAITVTTASGKVFDGDETSQGRMARAVIGMQAAGAPSITWVLANNTPATVTLAELTEALVLAGQEQARLWVIEGVHTA